MIKIFLLGLCVAIAATACNSVRRIDMRNDTSDSVQIIWKLEKDSLKDNPFFISSSEELKFTLCPPKTKSIKMSFGSGSWTPQEVQKLVGYLKSLEIISATQHLKIDSLPMLREYLLSRRKGLGSTIQIVVAN